MGRPELEDVLVTGCTGLASFGQRLVKGKIAATIIVPSTGALAVELIAGAYQGTPISPSVTVPSASYSGETILAMETRKTR
jgi:hypothetical protein